MKKLFLLILLLPAFTLAQSQFTKLDSLQFRKVVNQIISDTGINYQEEVNRQDWDENNLKFINPEDKNDIIFIEYRMGKYWNLNYIYANYERIFPIWKKYSDPTADKEVLKKSGFKMLDHGSITKFDKNVWRMEL